LTRRNTASTRTRGATSRAPLLDRQRRQETLGALLIVVAVITVISFVSHGGALTQRWLAALTWLLGWGVALVPVAVGALGAWLIVKADDERRTLRWERPLGGLLLFIAILGLMHVIAWWAAAEGQTLRDVAIAADGGGWLGFVIANALVLNLGALASVVVLVVLALVGVSLMLGRSLRETAGAGAQSAQKAAVAAWAWRPTISLRRRRRRRLIEATGQVPLTINAEGARGGAAGQIVAGAEAAVTVEGAAVGHDEPAEASVELSEAVTPGETLIEPVDTSHPRWRLPTVSKVLDESPVAEQSADEADALGRKIVDTLAEFGIPATITEINRGPSITQFGIEPGFVERGGRRSRVKVSRITSLQNDIALALAASPIRIQAPVPGRPYVGIEVPNSAMTLVSLRGVLESQAFAKVASKGALPIALGRDTSGRAVAADLAAMPHLLVAGATGSGKSVAINSIICALLFTHTPETLRLLLVDPKRVEMASYRGLPHLASPVVVEIDKVIGVLQWAVREMDRRYRAFADAGTRNIEGYNALMRSKGEEMLPYLVLFIDELADLMMIAPEEAERLITRLAQLARATGIHLVLATQRPSVDVVTGLIKANFPSRIAFAVSSSIDSRVILDSVGAEKLLGKGDMLYQASDDSKLRRLQGCFVSDAEIGRLVRYWKSSALVRDEEPGGAQEAPVAAEEAATEPLIQREFWEDREVAGGGPKRDALFGEAVVIVREHRTASASFLQRKLRIGYSRAARIIDELEEAGVVGPAKGNKPRDVLPLAEDQPHQPGAEGPAPGGEGGIVAEEGSTNASPGIEEPNPLV
jgi:S-DNA-T family DNA segregation ATPase FtsK/SpoIIIE